LPAILLRVCLVILFFAWLLSSVFFFQAEDGIRDGHVTGVQTCALPICSDTSPPLDRRGRSVRAVGLGCLRDSPGVVRRDGQRPGAAQGRSAHSFDARPPLARAAAQRSGGELARSRRPRYGAAATARRNGAGARHDSAE